MAAEMLPLADAAATEAFGRAFAARLAPGALIFLSGELGAGKTTFVRGLLAGLGGDPDESASPTYTYLHGYRSGRIPLHHADLFRLRGTADDLGLEECLGAGILAVEWPERCPDLGTAPWRLHFEHDGAARRVTVAAPAQS